MEEPCTPRCLISPNVCLCLRKMTNSALFISQCPSLMINSMATYQRMNKSGKSAELVPRMAKHSAPSRPLPPLSPPLPPGEPGPQLQLHAPFPPLALISSLRPNLELLSGASKCPAWPWAPHPTRHRTGSLAQDESSESSFEKGHRTCAQCPPCRIPHLRPGKSLGLPEYWSPCLWLLIYSS